LVTTTDDDGRFSFDAGEPGVVTASKSGLTTISVGWRNDSGTLRIELPTPATLSGRAYKLDHYRPTGR